MGKKKWEQAGVSHKINLKLGPAVDTLDLLLNEGQHGSFDFASIETPPAKF